MYVCKAQAHHLFIFAKFKQFGNDLNETQINSMSEASESSVIEGVLIG